MRNFVALGLWSAFGLLLGPLAAAEAALMYSVPIDVVTFANDDGSNQAVSQGYVQGLFNEMNSNQFYQHGMRMVISNFFVLNNTTHNSLSDGYQGAKFYVDGNIPRPNYRLATFFTQANVGSGYLWGVAWGGGWAPLGISYTDTGSSWLLAHEIGHNLGLLHLGDYAQPEYQDAANPNNVMGSTGGEFAPWQATIMKSYYYGYYELYVPEPSTYLLTGLGLAGLLAHPRFRRRKRPV